MSPLRILGLRRADEARARSPECSTNPSDHWSLSQEGTQKEKKNRLPPVKKNVAARAGNRGPEIVLNELIPNNRERANIEHLFIWKDRVVDLLVRRKENRKENPRVE